MYFKYFTWKIKIIRFKISKFCCFRPLILKRRKGQKYFYGCFIVLWPCLLTTKLRFVIRHNLGHSSGGVASEFEPFVGNFLITSYNRWHKEGTFVERRNFFGIWEGPLFELLILILQSSMPIDEQFYWAWNRMLTFANKLDHIKYAFFVWF